MGIVIAVSNMQISFPLDVNIEALAVISLIISVFIALLISDSKYSNRMALSTLDAITIPLLITFAGIVVYKITLIV
ncbi:MAG: hypothetical protein Q7J35_02940 [Candidatus Methanoperedens sp.]|nr:hypothetical protein [Candidatus Methanoperedens sp.]